jgi:hypothetical protein
LARGAYSPINDLGFVDQKTMTITGIQARSVACCTIHIVCYATLAANNVVVVVSNPGFVPGALARNLNSANEPCRFQGGEIIINRLGRERAEPFSSKGNYLHYIPMLPGTLYCSENSKAGRRNTEPSEPNTMLKAYFLCSHMKLPLFMHLCKFSIIHYFE